MRIRQAISSPTASPPSLCHSLSNPALFAAVSPQFFFLVLDPAQHSSCWGRLVAVTCVRETDTRTVLLLVVHSSRDHTTHHHRISLSVCLCCGNTMPINDCVAHISCSVFFFASSILQLLFVHHDSLEFFPLTVVKKVSSDNRRLRGV